jgi:hypothetical protein
MYEVWQFNSRNWPVKEKSAYLCTGSCCDLRNIPLVKLCTLWHNGATAGNNLDSRFLEFTVTSHCIGCQEYQHIFVPKWMAFFNLEKRQKSKGAKSGEWDRWSIFVLDILTRNSWTLEASCAEALSCRRTHLSGRSLGLFSKQIPVTLSALPNITVHLYSVHICISSMWFWLPTPWVILHVFSPLLEPSMPLKNNWFHHSIFTISQC